QDQVLLVRWMNRLGLSNRFRVVGAFDAVDVEQPIFSPQGKLRGSVSLLINPEALLSDIIVPAVQGMPVEVWAIQRDGRILYSPTPALIGQNVFHEPVCRPARQFHALVRQVAVTKSGAGVYDCRPQDVQTAVKKHAFWTTVDLHGTAWRLLVMRV